MKKVIILIAGLYSALVSMGQLTVNDPNADVRVAKDFHAISVSNAFDVYLTQGGEEAVAVSASDPKYRDQILVEVKNGILSIGIKSQGWKWMKGNKKLIAYISFKSID